LNVLRRAIQKTFQKFIDKVYGKNVDRASLIGYIVSIIVAMYVLTISLSIFKYPILQRVHNAFFFTFFIGLPMSIFYISMAGDYMKKPSRRVIQFTIVIFTTTILTFGYLVQIANTSFIGMLKSIKNIDVIPYSLLEGNIRIVSFFVPVAIVLPLLMLASKVLFNRDTKKVLIEYEVDFLLPNIYVMDDTSIDIKICEDLETGDDCIVPQKTAYEHFFLQGGTGSGKTATYIRPLLGQLFYMKSYLREQEKKVAHEALTEGLAYMSAPVTNQYFNKYFSMELIKPVPGKEEEYKKKFKKYIIGVRDKEVNIIDEEIDEGELSFKRPKSDSMCIVNIQVLEQGMECAEKEVKFNSLNVPATILIKEGLNAIAVKESIIGGLGIEVKNEDGLVINGNPDLEIEYTIFLNFPQLEDGFTYKVVVKEKGAGEIKYKGLGVTVVAPDGGLPKDTIKIAAKYGVKVHKIDPVMEEINKGGIGRFNPMLGDSPEKTGDIISSILISMEQTNGQEGNPYFVNASVRAVRNITILLKVMFPLIKGVNPTLVDVLDILNNFNLVVPLVTEMKKDEYLRRRWSSVISYFESSFFPPDVDDKGKIIAGATIGAHRKKTEEALGGIINQLDNFLGREEIKHILCSTEDSLDLAEVIDKGECIAIATRQNDLGERLGKAFALFFILSMQNAILSRYSEDENPEVPHYLVIDEFPFYLNDATKVFFSFARKYSCSLTIAIQNMAQLREVSDIFRETIFTNTSTKILLPKSNVEDREYWSKFFGIEERFEMQTGVTQSAILSDSPSYSESHRGTLTDKQRITEQDLNDMKFKQAFYTYTDSKGRQRVGKGITDFYKADEAQVIESQQFDFACFNRESIGEYNSKEKERETEARRKKEEIRTIFFERVQSQSGDSKNVNGFSPVDDSESIKTSGPEQTEGHTSDSFISMEGANIEVEDMKTQPPVVEKKDEIVFKDSNDSNDVNMLVHGNFDDMELEGNNLYLGDQVNQENVEELVDLDSFSDEEKKATFTEEGNNEESKELDIQEDELIILEDKLENGRFQNGTEFELDVDIEFEAKVQGTSNIVNKK
jgi:hypothetical protein